MLYIRYLLILLVGSILYGCGYKEVEVDNSFLNDLVAKYNSVDNANLEQQALYVKQFSNWHKTFNNSELDILIFLALNNNLDITKAVYNLQASALQLGSSRRALFPALSLEGQYSREDYSKEASKYLGRDPSQSVSTLGVTASYELDIWGKNYSAYRSAKSKVYAQQAEFDGVKISIIASMMNLWINLMALRETIHLLEMKCQDIGNMINIQENNYSSGNLDITDLMQQKSLLLEIQKQLDEMKYAEKDTLRSINILLGNDPLNELVIISDKLPELPTLPSEEMSIIVLANRPDVKVAFYDLVASKWDVKVANLSRLPSFGIQSVAQTLNQIDSNGFNIHLDAWLLKNVLQAGLPLFRAGELLNKEKAAKLLVQANVVNYKQIVFKAINELKTALDNESKYSYGVKNIKEQLNLMEETKLQLQSKYLNGDAKYLEYLNASCRVIDLKAMLTSQYKDMLLNRVIFYRTLGINIEDEGQKNEKT